jgi:carbamoyltransferase
MRYFDYPSGSSMTSPHFDALFGGQARKAESAITQKEMDLACSIQAVTEEIVMKIAETVRKEFRIENLCLAGGVALNCTANGKLRQSGMFKDIWIQPAAGDAGGACGAALSLWHEHLGMKRETNDAPEPSDRMYGCFLGPRFGNGEIVDFLDQRGAVYRVEPDEDLLPRIAGLLCEKKVIGWFQGRMEFGPRARGARSILDDPRDGDMQSRMNLKIKFRESFRPFAPSVRAEAASDWFGMEGESPYMLYVTDVKEEKRVDAAGAESAMGLEKLRIARSVIPAVTHVNCSARIQTVHRKSNPRFYALIEAFEKKTGCPVLINTSFNVRGEPIVCTPEDAYRCFMRTDMDYLVLENCILDKRKQPVKERENALKDQFVPD